MTLKKHIAFIAGGVAALLAIAAAVFFLIQGINKLKKTEVDLGAKKKELEEFHARKPFPSADNVAKEKKNAEELETAIADVLTAMRVGEIKPTSVTPPVFMDELANLRQQLNRRAEMAGMVLPDKFGFGFERYLGGDSSLPPTTDLPILTMQMAVIEMVSDILIREKAREILRVVRDEPATVTAGARPAEEGVRKSKAGTNDTDLAAEMYSRLSFAFEFKAKESSLLSILNALASNKTFMVVTSVKVDKEASDVIEIAAPGVRVGPRLSEEDDGPAPVDTKPAPPESKTRDQVLVAGPKKEKLMKVIMSLDVYRFKGD